MKVSAAVGMFSVIIGDGVPQQELIFSVVHRQRAATPRSGKQITKYRRKT